MNTNWILGTLLALTLTACEQDPIARPEPAPGETYTGHPRQPHYQKVVDEYVRTNRIPGAVILLKKGGEPVWIGASGFSNLEHGTAMQVNTPLRVASVTKMVVATAVLQLVEARALSLDGTLQDLLPAVKGRIPGAEAVTLRHLLTHTSGIFDPTNDDLQYQLELINNPARRLAMTPEEVLSRYVYGHALLFQPGERYHYSNINYLLIGKIVERVTGKALAAVLQERIFQPLGLSQTYLEPRDDRNVARGYADFYSNGKLMDMTKVDRAEASGSAYGGLISTASDLFRFSEALFGGRLVSAASLKEMMRPYPVRQGESIYGLGLDQWPSAALGTGYGHNGTLLGAEANLFYFPEKNATFVVLANYGSGTRKDFLEELLR